MSIKSNLEDTFEKIVEEGNVNTKKAIKTAGMQLKQTVSPTRIWEELLGVSAGSDSVDFGSEKTEHVVKNAGKNTPLDIEKLALSYQNNEKHKEEQLKRHLFRLVKEGEERILFDKRREEQEKKQKEIYEIQEKKKKEEERKSQPAELPKGKVRRSIFSPRKIVERSYTEVRPSTGKQ